MTEVRIRDIVANEGEKVSGFLDAATTSTTTYRIPVVIINGVKPGPTLAIYGGVHGLEYASIEGVQRVMKEVDPKELSGVLLIVPVLNQANFESRTAFLSPLDSHNQNRCWPGDPHGTISYRVTHTVFTEIASKADAQIDCHGGDLTEDIGNPILEPGYIIASQFGPEEADKKALDMAKCFNGKHIVLSKPADDPRLDRGSSEVMAARELGIPAITTEAGTPYPVRESQIEFHHQGIINVLKYYGMLEGKPKMTEAVIDPPGVRLVAKRGGIFQSFVDWESKIEAGQTVCEVRDLFGNVIDTYESPIDGILTFRRVYYSVNSGERLLGITNIRE